MKFKSYLNEEVLQYLDKDEIQTAKEILDSIKSLKLYKRKCRYRGFQGGAKNNGIAEVTNKRSGFYGNLSTVAKELVKHLKVKNPTFVAMDYTKAQMFGPVFIYVPYKKSLHHQSYVIKDIVADLPSEKPDEENYYQNLRKTYNSGGLEVCNVPNSEIIADTEKYYLIDYDNLVNSIRSKFFKPVNDWKNDITYGDIYDAIKSYISWSEYQIKNGIKPSYSDSLKSVKKTEEKQKKSKEERYNSKNREMRKEILEQDAIKNKWDIEIVEVRQKMPNVKTDGKAYIITTKYIKTVKEIINFYHKKDTPKYGAPLQEADKLSQFLTTLSQGKKNILLY